MTTASCHTGGMKCSVVNTVTTMKSTLTDKISNPLVAGRLLLSLVR